MFGEETFQEGDRVDIIDPLTRTVYGTSGTVVAVLRSRGLPTKIEVQIDGGLEQLVTLWMDEVKLA